MVDWYEEINYYGIDLQKVTYWEAGESIFNLTIEGNRPVIEDFEDNESMYPDGFVMLIWYGKYEDGADVVLEFVNGEARVTTGEE